MKSWVTTLILLVVIVSLVIIAVILTSRPSIPATPSTPPPNPYVSVESSTQETTTTASPATFAADFYAWYLQNLINNPGFTTSPQFKSSLGKWLTPDFINNWQKITTSTGSDPVTLLQDYQNSWLTNINPSIVDQSSTTSTVLASLGTPGELQRVIVHLVFANGTWLIASVTSAN
jgi:Protein of unknown function (DUF3828)